MKTIKNIAGNILLYFYTIQRNDYAALHDCMLSFQMRHFKDDKKGPTVSENKSEIYKNLSLISGDDNSLYNAIIYLYEKGFIDAKIDKSNVDNTIFNLKVNASGIDIIEGIERGSDERKVFNINFNIKVDNNIKVDSLIKAELGGLLAGFIK